MSDKAFSDGHKNAHKSQKNGVTQGELQQIENIKAPIGAEGYNN